METPPNKNIIPLYMYFINTQAHKSFDQIKQCSLLQY